MDNRDDIEKIDEQINLLKNKKNTVKKENDNHEVFVDKKYSLGDKVVDEVVNEEMEKTKVIEDITKIESDEIDKSIEKTDKEEESVESDEEITDNNAIELDDNTDKDIIDVEYKKKKKIILLVILFAILVIFVCILFIMTRKDKQAEYVVEEDSDNNINDEEKIINDYGKLIEETIRLYYSRNDKSNNLTYEIVSSQIEYKNYIYCFEHEIYDDGKIYLNGCSIDGKETKYGYGKKRVIPKEDEEGVYHIYVNKDTSIAQFDNPNNTNDYFDYSVKLDDISGSVNLLNEKDSTYIFYLDSSKNGHIINYKTGKKALSSIDYQSILPIRNGELFDYDYVAILVNNKWGIYRLSNNERIVPHIYDNMVVKNVGTNTNDNYIDSLGYGLIAVSNGDFIGVVSYYSGQEIIPTNYKSLSKNGNYYIAVDSKDIYHILDSNGLELLDQEYNKIYGIVSDKYILVKKKNNVLLIGLKEELYYDYLKINTDNYNYGTEYDGMILFQFYKEDSKCVNLYYDPINKTGEIKDSDCN